MKPQIPPLQNGSSNCFPQKGVRKLKRDSACKALSTVSGPMPRKRELYLVLLEWMVVQSKERTFK